VRLFALAPLALLACTSTYTATIDMPARVLTTSEASCVTMNGACARIIFHDEISSSFATDSKAFSIDGALVREAEYVPLRPGRHTAIAETTLHFDFIDMCVHCHVQAYVIHVRSVHTFDVGKDASVTLHAIAYEKGPTIPIEEHPTMRWVNR
jgi:hypothetical protein